jgi:hypothetical protein
LSHDAEAELVLVVAVSSFTKRGFLGSASYQGQSIDIEFHEKDGGVYLTPEMCRRIRAKKGSKVLVVVEAEDEPVASEAVVAGLVSKPRIANARIYYEVGKAGGAIIRIRKA